MKKIVLFAFAATLVYSVPVMAKEVGAPVAVYLEESSDIGDPDVTNAAIEEDKLVGEYMNNAVTGIWAMDKVTPVAQGGGVVVDGVKTNLTFSVLKPELRRVYTIKNAAASIGGTVLNVVKIGIPANLRYQRANVNFYTPGIVTGQNVKVFQYAYSEGENDIWNELNVTEVREDHVVVDIPNNGGVIAFVEVPVQTPATVKAVK